MNIRVQAVGDARVPYRTESGALVLGRFVGRDAAGAILPDGEVVRDTSEIRRDIKRGLLALVTEG